MARGRFISDSVAKDLRLNSVSVEAELVYLMTIPHLDRDGLIEGDSEILLGTVCPKRRQFLDMMDSIISEWATVGLVVSYPTQDGQVLWFRGFTKNQQGLRYERETPSKFPAPPGHEHSKTGLVCTNSNDPGSGGDNIRQDAGGVRQNALQVQGQVQGQDQVEVKEAATPAPATLDTPAAIVWGAWDKNMPGTKSPVITEGVNHLLVEYSPAEIVEAIAISCRRNKRSLSYVQGILEKGVFAEMSPPTNGDHKPPKGGRGRDSPVDKTQAAADELRAMLKAQGKEGVLRG